ncbi:hypothetical protein HaLaN_32898, partial [Haematococcus lacustris]
GVFTRLTTSDALSLKRLSSSSKSDRYAPRPLASVSSCLAPVRGRA